jgi:hypothetical protein
VGKPSGRDGFDYQHIQALRSRVNGRCQAGGSGADNDQIAHLRFVNRAVQSQAIGHFLQRGIPQHGATVAKDHRNFVQFHVKPVEKCLRRLVRVEIHVGVRMLIPAEEFAQAQRIGRVARTQQDHVPLAATDQFQPAQDEGPHENLAQLGIPCDERPQTIRTQFQKLTGLGDPAAHQAAPSGNHGHLAGELAWAVFCYQALAPTIRLHDLHAPGKQDEKRDVCIVGLKQDFTRLNVSEFAAGANAIDLSRGKDWKSLGTSVECTGYQRRRHFSSSSNKSRKY